MQLATQFVCNTCFSDSGLVDYITRNASEFSCSFCSKTDSDPISVQLVDVASHMNRCLYREYDIADSQLPHDSEDGGFWGRHWDTYDLLYDEIELDLPNDLDGSLRWALLRFIDDNTW